jgi:hypothetical protein
MAVAVSDGNGWLSNDNADGIVWWIDNESKNHSKLELAVDIGDAALPRIDRVVVSWETTNYEHLPEVKILKGVAAASPVAPALTNNNLLRQISLAAIRVPAAADKVEAGMIIDERLDKNVCGLATCGIGVDTDVMQGQFEALLRGIQKELADLEAGSGVEMAKLQFADVEATFETDTTYEGYPFRAAVGLDGVIGSMIPEVIFSLADATSGIFAPVAECYNGGVYLYSNSAPDGDVTIPTIICWKGNA